MRCWSCCETPISPAMRKLHLLFAGLLGLLVNSCSDSTSTEDGDNNGGVDRSFAIVSISQDSVYLGETVTITLKNAATDQFTLFVHSLPITIQSATRNADSSATITFVVPQDAETGLLRVFEQQSIEAKGSRTLVIFPRDRSTMFPTFDHFAPGRVYAGDLFVITGTDIPMRASDMEVKIGDVSLPIVSWDPVRIFTRIPAAVQTGPVTLRMFDQVFQLGTVVKLEHSGQLLQEGTVSAVWFYSARMQGVERSEVIVGGDTTVTERAGRIGDTDFSWTFNQGFPVRLEGDSLIGVAEQPSGEGTVRLEFRVRLEPESRISGAVRLAVISPEVTSFWEAKVSHMRWIRSGEKYIIQTHSIDLPAELLSYFYGNHTSEGGNSSIFDTGEETSVINIDLTP